MVNKYLHQQVDGVIVEMSDQTLSIEGVRHRPRWPWSPDFRSWFRAGHSYQDTSVAEERRAAAYREWLADRDRTDQTDPTCPSDPTSPDQG